MTAELAASSRAHPLRALPVPQCEPHPVTTDPSTRATTLTQVHPAQCALSLVVEPPAYRPRAPIVPGRRRARGLDEAEPGPRRTPAAELPDPVPLVAAVVSASIEVIAGSRPAAQLLRWLSADVYATIQRRAATEARQRRRAAPVRRTTVRRVLTSSPCDGVVEAAVVVGEARRVLAVAVRLEGLDGRWRVTALEVG